MMQQRISWERRGASWRRPLQMQQKNKAAMEAAWKKYLDALKKEAEAHKSEVDKDGEHDKAHADLEKIKQEIKNEADDVEYEITDLEDCKKKLIAAKAKLK